MKKNKKVSTLIIFIAIFVLLGSSSTDSKKISPGYRLVVYYGIPEGVNNLWDIDKAAKVFSEYDYVVFGDKLQLSDNVHFQSTKEIISKINKDKPSAIIFGYVDLGVTTDNLSMNVIKERIDQWKSIGIKGIFFDDAGYDYKVSRARFNEAVKYVHSVQLSAFINAWHPDQVMGSAIHPTYNPSGEKTALGRNDYYLLEDFLQSTDITKANSPSVFTPTFRQKIDKVLHYRKTMGVRLLSVSVMDYTSFSSTAVRKFFRMNESAAGIFSLDGYGIAPLDYSSSEVSEDKVTSHPYISNFMEYYNVNVQYISKYGDKDFASKHFRLHSVKGKHFYNYPATAEY
ncbi:hypothetical protein [Paenibacillus sp. CMAA1364]